MTSQPNETAREDVANALQVLEGLVAPRHFIVTPDSPTQVILGSLNDDLLAIRARLRSALAKLDREGPPVGWTETKSEDRAMGAEEVEP